MTSLAEFEWDESLHPRDERGRFGEGSGEAKHDSPTPHGVARDAPGVYWHGTPSGDLRGGAYGLHLGTYQAATEALEARIGKPAVGTWDGTRRYGDTPLDRNYRAFVKNEATGEWEHKVISEHAPSVPTGTAVYSDGERVSLDARPDILPFRVTGKMTNTPDTPHDDFKANGYMHAAITRGSAKSGYYYSEVGEDAGSIAIVVPNGDHLKYAGTDGLRASAEFAWNEFYSEDQERDEHGRWTSGGSSDSGETDKQTVGPGDPSVAEAAQRAADRFAADFDPTATNGVDGYRNLGEDWNTEHLIEEGAAGWQPGTASATSEAVGNWENSFNDSRDIQLAASALLGHDDGAYSDRGAAMANELLSALIDGPPEGAITPYAFGLDEFGDPVSPERMTFGTGDELVRGMNDDSGEASAFFRDAADRGEDVSFSLASFVIGGDLKEAYENRIIDETGEERNITDWMTGDERPPTSVDDAMRYTAGRDYGRGGILGTETEPTAGVLVRLEGPTVALNLDGGFEALTGGRFAITNITDSERPAPIGHSIIPVAEVTLRQVALPERPR